MSTCRVLESSDRPRHDRSAPGRRAVALRIRAPQHRDVAVGATFDADQLSEVIGRSECPSEWRIWRASQGFGEYGASGASRSLGLKRDSPFSASLVGR